MRLHHLPVLFLIGIPFAFLDGAAYSQTPASLTGPGDPAEPRNEANTLTHYLKRTVKIQGSIRARWEATEGSDFTLTPADSYLLTRIRLGIAFQPMSWLRFYGEGQDARAEFYRTTPPAAIINPFDFRQGYLEVGSIEGSGINVRFGRQELLLGSGRLVTNSDWSNVSKSFDIVSGTIRTSQMKVVLLAGSPLLCDPTREDRHKPGEHFYAAYATFSDLVPGMRIEPYLMAKTALNVKGKDGVLGNADTLFGGVRLIGTIRGGFDYSAEAVREGGDYSTDIVQALGYVAGGGWTLPGAAWKPRVSTDYLRASGDSGRKDGHHQSFDFLYGSNQPLNSMTGVFCWRNIEDWRAGVDFAPSKKLTVKVDFRDYWLATVQDGLYNSSNTRIVFSPKASSNHVGEGIDALVTAKFTSKTLVGIGVGFLSPGSFLTQSGKTSGFVYPFVYLTRQL